MDSVRNQTYPAREIIVVIDNNEELLRRAEQEIAAVTVVPNSKERGLSGGRMTGVELATAPIIVFLDDDAAAADEYWLANLLDAYQGQHILGVGGHIEPAWHSTAPSWFPPEFNWIVGCTFKGMPRDPLPGSPNSQVRSLIGANMSVRAEVLHRAGGFTTNLGKREGGGTILGVIADSGEETEFGIRASQLYPGSIWVHCPRARVNHTVPAERSTWKYFVRRCRKEGTAKAVIAGLTGTRDGLAAERRYVLTLVGTACRYALTGQIGRAAAICAGLSITTMTYIRARLAGKMTVQRRGEALPA